MKLQSVNEIWCIQKEKERNYLRGTYVLELSICMPAIYLRDRQVSLPSCKELVQIRFSLSSIERTIALIRAHL
jgi:hypothetical protein